MSHYISAGYGPHEDESVEFSLGIGHRTLSALEDSGFDIYGVYNAYDFHNGMSGSGGDKVVPVALGKSAFTRACIWARLFSEKWPEKYAENFDQEDHKEHLSIIALVDQTSVEYDKTVEKVRFELEYANEKYLERAISYLGSVLYFTKWIFDATQEGHEVRIYFY